MILTEYRALFMHIPKTGGTSIERAFGSKHETLMHAQHWRPKHFRAYLGVKKWNSYYKFVFVRNPWDRVVSHFFFYRDVQKILPRENTFLQYIRGQTEAPIVSQQYEFFEDNINNFNFIGRFETLQKDYEQICKQIDAPYKTLGHYLNSKHRHYSYYYTKELQWLVEDLYREDIEIFGYKFEH